MNSGKTTTAAYTVLSDAKRRKLYDEFGEAALQAGFDEEKAEQYRRFGGGGRFDFNDWSQGVFSGGGVEDLLGSLFGGRFRGFGGRERGPRRGHDLETELAVDLPLAVRGGTAAVRLARPGSEPLGHLPGSGNRRISAWNVRVTRLRPASAGSTCQIPRKARNRAR